MLEVQFSIAGSNRFIEIAITKFINAILLHLKLNLIFPASLQINFVANEKFN